MRVIECDRMRELNAEKLRDARVVGLYIYKKKIIEKKKYLYVLTNIIIGVKKLFNFNVKYCFFLWWQPN